MYEGGCVKNCGFETKSKTAISAEFTSYVQ